MNRNVEHWPRKFIINLNRDVNVFNIDYTAIESLKDGILTCTKYESDAILYACPHVVIFANALPKMVGIMLRKWILLGFEQVNEVTHLVPIKTEPIAAKQKAKAKATKVTGGRNIMDYVLPPSNKDLKIIDPFVDSDDDN